MHIDETIMARGRDPAALLAFFMAQRSGSRALVAWLQRHLAKSEVYYYRNVDPFVHWRRSNAEILRSFRVYYAFSEFRPMDMGRPLVAFSVARHPVYRIASLYEMSKVEKTHRYHELSLRATLRDYYREGSADMPNYFHNVNCYRICERHSFDMALETMGSHYGLVGLTEHLDRLSAKLASTYGWPLDPLPPATPDAAKYEALVDPATFAEIAEGNAEDIKLYDYLNGLARAPQSKPTRQRMTQGRRSAKPSLGMR